MTTTETRAWGTRSLAIRAQLHPMLQAIVDFILNEVSDISLTTGHRGEAAQNEAFRTGHSKVKWPHGKHNTYPSIAVDLQPYPYPRSEIKLRQQLAYIAGRAIEYGRQRGVQVRWGGDWNQDGSNVDNAFDDLFHLELRL